MNAVEQWEQRASGLNRPETQGKWSMGAHATSGGHAYHVRCETGFVCTSESPIDMAAIADLPAWIEAHDKLAQEVSDLRLRVAQLLNEKDDESLRLREIERFGGAA